MMMMNDEMDGTVRGPRRGVVEKNRVAALAVPHVKARDLAQDARVLLRQRLPQARVRARFLAPMQRRLEHGERLLGVFARASEAEHRALFPSVGRQRHGVR